MDFYKVSTILNCAQTYFLCYIRSFFGFCNVYWRFIWDFSKFAKPFTSRIEKDTPFDWLSSYQLAFDNLNKIVTQALIICYYKQGIKTIVETYSWDYINSVVFFQLGNNRILYPILFFSKNINSAECNYVSYYKELLAII